MVRIGVIGLGTDGGFHSSNGRTVWVVSGEDVVAGKVSANTREKSPLTPLRVLPLAATVHVSPAPARSTTNTGQSLDPSGAK